jgi:ABC-type thiamine transport system substrate-binding protein
VFAENTTIPGQPTRFTPETIAEKRDAWIDEWVAIMEG